MIRTVPLAVFMTFSFYVSAAQETPPDLTKAKQLAETVCVACHGADGNSAISTNPILAGQGAEYLLKQLSEFKASEGKPALRSNAIMAGIASTLALDDMKGLAVYFSQQKRKPASATDDKLVAMGQNLWRKGDFNKGIPACSGCHGPTGAGVPALFPRLAGQYAEYTEVQLKNFRSEDRSNDAGRMMRTVADKLSEKQIKALADYIAGLR